MPAPDSQNPLAGPHTQHRGHHLNWPQSCVRVNHPTPRKSLFGHVTRLAEDTPAHQALQCHVDITLNHPPDRSWRRHPGHPRNGWLDQFVGTTQPADLWRRAFSRGHSEGNARVLSDYVLMTNLQRKCCDSFDQHAKQCSNIL